MFFEKLQSLALYSVLYYSLITFVTYYILPVSLIIFFRCCGSWIVFIAIPFSVQVTWTVFCSSNFCNFCYCTYLCYYLWTLSLNSRSLSHFSNKTYLYHTHIYSDISAIICESIVIISTGMKTHLFPVIVSALVIWFAWIWTFITVTPTIFKCTVLSYFLKSFISVIIGT